MCTLKMNYLVACGLGATVSVVEIYEHTNTHKEIHEQIETNTLTNEQRNRKQTTHATHRQLKNDRRTDRHTQTHRQTDVCEWPAPEMAGNLQHQGRASNVCVRLCPLYVALALSRHCTRGRPWLETCSTQPPQTTPTN